MSFAVDYKQEGAPGSLTPRGVFVPPWYAPHKDLSLPVRSHDGTKELGFTIADVAVERRWAIDAEGKVMHNHEFKDMLTEWYVGQWKWQNPPQPALQVDTSSYPHPEQYVAKGPNPADNKRLIGLGKPSDRLAVATERPVDTASLQRAGWSQKKDK